ncbi:MAG: ImmA/IrrE family metallo-endopeptidase [Clostridiales bacterium]|nr:ImmA/IrrE family metallo-endopeptidase [Clostridiales bacterium]MDY4172653.1 ImmA/IrrE family metallo-endopeptidase [Evtepia sp.]
MDTLELYQDAQREDIPIIALDIPENGSMCVQGDLRCYIGVDYNVLEDEASKRVHLAHELGHCITGSFYNIWAARDVRQKHELRADKWAIERMIPVEALDQAVAEGYTDIWALADYFGVTEEFMRKAVCWHTHGNLDTELYFG